MAARRGATSIPTRALAACGVAIASFSPTGQPLFVDEAFKAALALPTDGPLPPIDKIVGRAAKRDRVALDEVFAGRLASCVFPLPLKRGGGGVELRFSRTPNRRVVCVAVPSPPAEMEIEALRGVVLALSGVSGIQFFERLALSVAAATGSEAMVVTDVWAAGKWGTALAVAEGGTVMPCFDYPLEGTVAGTALASEGVLVCRSGARRRFPRDPYLQRLGAEAVAAVALRSSTGSAIGALVMAARQRFADRVWVDALLTIFARRASVELIRWRMGRRMRQRDQLRSVAHASARTTVWYWDVERNVVRRCGPRNGVVTTRAASVDGLLAALECSDRKAGEEKILRAVEAREGFELSLQVQQPDGRRVLQVKAWPDRTRSSAHLRYVGTVEDTTAGEAAIDALMLLSRAVEQSASHIAIANRAGIVHYVNPAWRNHLGAETEIVGRPLRVLLGEDYVHEPIAKLQPGQVFKRVFERRDDDDSSRFEETTISVIRDTTGQGDNVVVVGTDITSRRRAEADSAKLEAVIRNAAREWRNTVDAIESPIILFDRDGGIRRLNRAARDLLGVSKYSIVGRSLDEVGRFQPWLAAQRLISQASRSRAAASEHVHDSATGNVWDIVATYAPGDEGPDGVTVVIRDITARVQLEESLRRTHVMAAMGSLVGGVAHEMKNPIFGISATLDALQANFGDEPRYAPYVVMLRREADRLKTLTHDLLEYGRPAQVELHDLSIGVAVAAAVSLCSSASAEHRVRVENSVPHDFGVCRADEHKLQQAFRNLIENAMQHSPSGGTVTITGDTVFRGGQAFVRCSVLDHGPGFRPEDLPRVFEPFFTRRFGGTGLGLSIVQRTVEEHGGQVTAANHYGGGAVVTVEIPASTSPHTHHPEEPTHAS